MPRANIADAIKLARQHREQLAALRSQHQRLEVMAEPARPELRLIPGGQAAD